MLEDRLRAHWLVSQCMVVGDDQPFIAALVTIDADSFPAWKKQAGKPESATVADLVDDPDLVAEVQKAVDEANKAVSKAESIRKFAILPGGLDRGGRPADPVAEAQAQRRHEGVRRRGGRAVRLTSAERGSARTSPRDDAHGPRTTMRA